MPITHCEVSIQHHIGPIQWLKTIFTNSEVINPESIVVLFDDGTIYNAMNESPESAPFIFSPNGTYISNIECDVMIYPETPIFIDGVYNLSFKHIKTQNQKYKLVPSRFNRVYYILEDTLEKSIVLTVVKWQSNDVYPQFLVEYDSDYFSKPELLYILKWVFYDSV